MTELTSALQDAMSNAVEWSEVILYGVSKRYKESANCRLEANYGHQHGSARHLLPCVTFGFS